MNSVRFNFDQKILFLFPLSAWVLEIYIERANKGKGYVVSNSTFNQSCDRSSPGSRGLDTPDSSKNIPLYNMALTGVFSTQAQPMTSFS